MDYSAAAIGGDGSKPFRAYGGPGRRPGEAERRVVLFVEDEPSVRFTTTAELTDAGYSVVAMGSGEEALALLHGPARIDALLTDLRLPGKVDGWDIAERARELRPGLPVIYASAYSYATPRRVPGSLMLDKPYPPDMLLDALDDLLDQAP